MHSTTSPVVALFALFALVIVGCEVASVMLDKQQAVANTAHYAQQEAKRDARLKDACDKHQTGVVLFYKGKNCE